MILGKRDKILVWLSLCAVTIFLLLQFLVFPVLDKKNLMERGVKVKEAGLREIVKLRDEYETYKKGARGIQNILRERKRGFTLFSFLEKAAGKAGVKSHIKYMKPSESKGTGAFKESTVEMKLEGITLQQLVDYLYLVQSRENAVTVKRLSITESKEVSGYLNAILQVLTVGS